MDDEREYSRDEIFSAIKSLKVERTKADMDFYSDRRDALDMAIFFLRRAMNDTI